MEYPIKVDYEYTDNVYKADKWLKSLPDLIAMDFETASIFTKKRKEILKLKLDSFSSLTFEEQRLLNQQILSNGLSHPSLTTITHLSVAWSDRNSFVIVCSNKRIRNTVLNFIVNTDRTQLWHNCIFDFKHVFYNTKQLPKNYIDTQLLAKCILNDANSAKDSVRLKELMAYAYGDWAVSKDDFTIEEMWNPDMIRYAATDSCACMKLYEDIMKDQQKWKLD